MAKKAKKQLIEADITPARLAGSYTQETAGNLLRKNGVMLRHKEVKKELFSKDSIYRQLMHLPALAIHNQTLILRVIQAKEYVQEKLTNIIFAVTAVKARNPGIQKPLSEKRQEIYSKIQENSKVIARDARQLSKQHNQLYAATFDKMSAHIKKWRKLCGDSALEITNALREKGFELPDDFADILQKHLERSGSNEISANELSAMNIKNKPGYAEMALVCALKEVENDGKD